jgi:SulP family sulfate permease
MASLLYIYRISETTTVGTVTDEYIEDGWLHLLQDKHVPDYVTILRIRPIPVGVRSSSSRRLNSLTPIVIRLRVYRRSTQQPALLGLWRTVYDSGRRLLICGARDQQGSLISAPNFTQSRGMGRCRTLKQHWRERGN